MAELMAVALYARISTHEGKQSAENQLRELRALAARHGWTIYREYVDEASGAKARADRAALDELLQDAALGRFAIVAVFALDRLTREGVPKAFEHIEYLSHHRVEFRSLTEPHFSTSGPHGELFIAIAAWMAKQERIRLRERVTAGLDRARANGTKLGRPAEVFDLARAQTMIANGASRRETAAALRVKLTTLQRRLTAAAAAGAEKREL